jgi:hypothetical protein
MSGMVGATTGTAPLRDEYSKITVKIKVCGDSWAELRKRLPALFK